MAAYRAKAGKFQVIEVPTMQYLMIDGHGDPNTAPEYVQALQALYPVAYKLKFASRNELGRDYVVPPLEGLWWAQDMDTFTVARDKTQWDWTMMIMVPDWIRQDLFDAVLAQVGAQDAPAALDLVRLEHLEEGCSVQTLHVGSYDEEAGVLAQMHGEFIPQENLQMIGKHHEIYLSDPRRTAPEKLRTILRQLIRTRLSELKLIY
ncbi:GyrI-like domain-containing protein [Jonesiaceae bacterium BS-20]|uniref:GyrI-like domain-containing protein n=1 Tax=Jonesiaceae bacterium BS-20 TaxID=3120821 RepID=A0AAU7DVR1_9MICO